jgi:glycosyltransferase involved in cell wall biosynthesis
MPGVRVLIAGTKPTAEVLKLANKTVTVTGWIPDLREAYEQADVFVAPLRIGTGQQNKILEAMSMSLPCITSTHVMNGLPKIGNIAPPLLLADDVVATAKAIDTLLKKEEIRLKLGRESRSWIEINCSWEVQSGALEMSFVNSTIYKPEEATWKIKR